MFSEFAGTEGNKWRVRHSMCLRGAALPFRVARQRGPRVAQGGGVGKAEPVHTFPLSTSPSRQRLVQKCCLTGSQFNLRGVWGSAPEIFWDLDPRKTLFPATWEQKFCPRDSKHCWRELQNHCRHFNALGLGTTYVNHGWRPFWFCKIEVAWPIEQLFFGFALSHRLLAKQPSSNVPILTLVAKEMSYVEYGWRPYWFL